MKLVYVPVLMTAIITTTACNHEIDPSRSEASLASTQTKVYQVEPMICGGKIDKRPGGIHTNYAQILVKLTSFKSKRTDGRWVDSLVINNDYFDESEAINYNTETFGEEWYSHPLSISGKQVTLRGIPRTNDSLELTIVSSTTKNGKKIDTLKGTYTFKGTVVGTYTYELECKATVVPEPSRRDDFTRK